MDEALSDFISRSSDASRLAMGLDRLEAALSAARREGLVGWEVEIVEHTEALRGGCGLNRPLG